MIAVGGVLHGHEALAVLRSGIKAIQVASAVVKEGVAAFARMKRELILSLPSQENVLLLRGKTKPHEHCMSSGCHCTCFGIFQIIRQL